MADKTTYSFGEIDLVQRYEWKDKDVQAIYIYYGFSKTNNWKFKRKTIATSVWGTAIGADDYETAWADRENKEYT